MVRPKRQRKAPEVFEAAGLHSRNWSVKDKQKLLSAMRRHGKDNIDKLARALHPRKTRKEIEVYLKGLQTRASRFIPGIDHSLEAPIETWLSLSEELVGNHEDYSDILAKIVSILGSLEPHLPSKTNREADYTAIYRYMAAVMNGDSDLPPLKDLNAAIVLDLIQYMADMLEKMDLTVQRQLVIAKYRLLKTRIALDEPLQQRYENTRRALQNDIEIDTMLSARTSVLYPHETPAESEDQPSSSQSEAGTQPMDQSPPSSHVDLSNVPGTSGLNLPPVGAAVPVGAGQAVRSPSPASFSAPPAPPSGVQQVIRLPPGFKLPPGQYQFTPDQLQALLKSHNIHVPKVIPTPKVKPAPSSAAGAPSSAVSAPSSAAGVPSSAVSAPSPAVSAPSSAVGAPSSAVSAPSSAVSAPSPAVSAPSSAAGAPSSAAGSPMDITSGDKANSSQSSHTPMDVDIETLPDSGPGTPNANQGNSTSQKNQDRTQQGNHDSNISKRMTETCVDLTSEQGFKPHQQDNQDKDSAKKSEQPRPENIGDSAQRSDQTQSESKGNNGSALTPQPYTACGNSNVQKTKQPHTDNAAGSRSALINKQPIVAPGPSHVVAAGQSGVSKEGGPPVEGIAALDEVVVSPVKNPEGAPPKAPTKASVLPKRTTMYSLNPFCIPVRYLNPQPKQQQQQQHQQNYRR